MQVSIRIGYRIVKTIRDGKTYFVPQYQEETDLECTFHNFRKKIHGKCGGYNDIYFSNIEDAKICIEADRAIQDKIVWRGGTDNYQNPEEGPVACDSPERSQNNINE
jgi:hypothetical protein